MEDLSSCLFLNSFPTVMANFVSTQLSHCANIQPNIILAASVRMFVEKIYIKLVKFE